jgi:hypothetical protein
MAKLWRADWKRVGTYPKLQQLERMVDIGARVVGAIDNLSSVNCSPSRNLSADAVKCITSLSHNIVWDLNACPSEGKIESVLERKVRLLETYCSTVKMVLDRGTVVYRLTYQNVSKKATDPQLVRRVL